MSIFGQKKYNKPKNVLILDFENKFDQSISQIILTKEITINSTTLTKILYSFFCKSR